MTVFGTNIPSEILMLDSLPMHGSIDQAMFNVIATGNFAMFATSRK